MEYSGAPAWQLQQRTAAAGPVGGGRGPAWQERRRGELHCALHGGHRGTAAGNMARAEAHWSCGPPPPSVHVSDASTGTFASAPIRSLLTGTPPHLHTSPPALCPTCTDLDLQSPPPVHSPTCEPPPTAHSSTCIPHEQSGSLTATGLTATGLTADCKASLARTAASQQPHSSSSSSSSSTPSNARIPA